LAFALLVPLNASSMPGQVDAEDYSPFRPPGFSLGAYAAAEHTAPAPNVSA